MSALFSPPGSCRKASFPIPSAYAQGGAPSFAPPLRPFFMGLTARTGDIEQNVCGPSRRLKFQRLQ